MKANYNVTGNDRKALVAAIEKLTGDKAVYMRMPTCAYEIGDITVDKEGSVTCEDADKLERIIHSLIADGFTPEDTEEVESDDEATGLTVSLPLDKVAVGNLTNLLTAKESLIKKALGIDDLGIEVTEDTVSLQYGKERFHEYSSNEGARHFPEKYGHRRQIRKPQNRLHYSFSAPFRHCEGQNRYEHYKCCLRRLVQLCI